MTDGALSGAGAYLRVYDLDNSTWINVGSTLSDSNNKAAALIDITNKISGGYREMLAGEGLRTADITSDFILSSDVGLEFIKNLYHSRTAATFQFWRTHSSVDEMTLMVTSVVETANDNAAVTASITFQSSGVITDNIAFEFFNVVEGQFKVLGGIPFMVRK